MNRIQGFGIAVTLVLLIVCLPWIPIFEVYDLDKRKIIYKRYAPPSFKFDLSVFHSVELGHLTDRLRVEPNGSLRLVCSKFPTHGSGLPAVKIKGETWIRNPKEFVLCRRGKIFWELILRVEKENRNPLQIHNLSDNSPHTLVPKIGPGIYKIAINKYSPMNMLFQ
jgi:hypothetical protein